MKSDVYFVSLSSSHLKERQVALARLIEKANPHLTFREGEFVPVKITIGDTDCVYHVHPALVSMIIAAIAQQKAKPFLFDTSVIYKGQRQNAIDHLALAQRKGFTYEQTGAPFIVADGVFGNDGKEFTVSSNDIKKVRTPSFVGMVDSLLVLSHATGHIVSGYAGAIKNVAMGMSCRATKQVQHSSLKPSVIEKRCTACGCCIAICPVKAITYVKKKAFIDQGVCVGCGECLCACKFDAILLNWKEDPAVFCRRMVDVAQAVLSKFKQRFFITFALDITKECDCISGKNEPMIADNIGILASHDIVSLDKATTDLACASQQTDFLERVKTTYDGMLAYAAKKRLGNLDYTLIKL